jgi:Fur family zinc uptake transcriptional regulator
MAAGGFSARTETLLGRAGKICAARGVRLTELRRQVLGLILDAEAPTGAYDLLELLRQTRLGAAPPTVYRALDFLREQGLIHRLERLSAFVGCVAPEPAAEDHDHDPGHGQGHAHGHAAQFLICRTCAKVTEIEDSGLAQALRRAAQLQGFAVSGATIEAEGVCAACAPSAGA